MFRDDIVKNSLEKPEKARILAKAIDLGFVLTGIIFFYPMGLILGIIYIIFSDSLYEGQSVGKRFIGIRVVSTVDGMPCSLKQSFLRNLPFTIPLFFLLFPSWVGWIFAIIFALPLPVLESYFLFKEHTCLRMGDLLADTTVISYTDQLNRIGYDKELESGSATITMRNK